MLYKLDNIEKQIINILQKNARIPESHIAKQLGVSQASINRRIKRLVSEKIIDLGALSDPFKTGFDMYVHILIQVEHGALEEVVNKLAQINNLFFIGETTGPFDIFCAGFFRSTDDYGDFIHSKLQKITGISRSETIHVYDIVKRSYKIDLPLNNELDEKGTQTKAGVTDEAI